MTPSELGLQFTGGINAPEPQDAGEVAFVNDTGDNLRYGSSTSLDVKLADGTEIGTATIDVLPTIFSYQSHGEDVIVPRLIKVPLGYTATIKVAYHAQSTTQRAHHWTRTDFENVVGVPSIIGTTQNENTPVDTLVGTSLVFDVVDTVSLRVRLQLATVHAGWTVVIEARVYPMTGPGE